MYYQRNKGYDTPQHKSGNNVTSPTYLDVATYGILRHSGKYEMGYWRNRILSTFFTLVIRRLASNMSPVCCCAIMYSYAQWDVVKMRVVQSLITNPRRIYMVSEQPRSLPEAQC